MLSAACCCNPNTGASNGPTLYLCASSMPVAKGTQTPWYLPNPLAETFSCGDPGVSSFSIKRARSALPTPDTFKI